MSLNYQFSLALKALREIRAETDQGLPDRPSAFPKLEDVLGQIGPFPESALLLGIASDGLPLMLNLLDPAPGPILIAGDKGSGKTNFLCVLARAANLILQPDMVQFAVLTSFPEEWRNTTSSEDLLGIWSLREENPKGLFADLVDWTNLGIQDKFVILLVDGLDAVSQIDLSGQEYLKNIFLTGPQNHIWPIVTVNSFLAADFPEWLDYFHTRIFGRIAERGLADRLAQNQYAGLGSLYSGVQFSLRQRASWLRFWLPSLG